ncbi:MAG: hypothetical protein ACTHN7_12525 [Solirubrobacterales bacterium]
MTRSRNSGDAKPAARIEVPDGLDLFDGEPVASRASGEAEEAEAKVEPPRDAKGKAQFADDE